MGREIRIKKYSCLLYSEGGTDNGFLESLCNLGKFKDYYAKDWSLRFDHAFGGSPRDVLERCRRESRGIGYHLILCFIDLDKLKSDYPQKYWQQEKENLEAEYLAYGIIIIWQEDNLEDEYEKVLGKEYRRYGKRGINKIAKEPENLKKFINLDYWNKIKNNFVEKEKELEEG